MPLSNQLDHLAAMERAASKRKWMFEGQALFTLDADGKREPIPEPEQLAKNAELIAALRNSAPELIAVVRAAHELHGPHHEPGCQFSVNYQGICWCRLTQKKRLDEALAALANVLPVAGEVAK